jgi:hypothetical protein
MTGKSGWGIVILNSVTHISTKNTHKTHTKHTQNTHKTHTKQTHHDRHVQRPENISLVKGKTFWNLHPEKPVR